MNIAKLVGKAQTVLEAIDPGDLGITLTHEHCLIDMLFWFMEPSTATGKLVARQPLSYENLWFVRYHPFSNRDNVQLLDEGEAINELLYFKRAGGSSVVDMTNNGIGRDPLALARISRATGLNIIMGSGYYVRQIGAAGTMPTEEMVTEEIVRDITVGVGDTGIKAGVIGEIGTEWPMEEIDKIAVRAAAHAQKETGAPMTIHPGHSPNCPFEIIELLDKAGADLNRVVISHIESRLPGYQNHDARVRLAKTGCYIAYDTFSFEGWMPEHIRMVLSEDNPVKADMPNDAARINEIMVLVKEGFLNQILISHDHCWKSRLCRYGGPGYAHILDNVVPLMQQKGMTQEQIHTILIENPRRLLCFV